MYRAFLCVLHVLLSFIFLSARLEAQAHKKLTNTIGMEFIEIPAGSFLMGSEKNEKSTTDYGRPQHIVTISRPFFLGKYEVTQEQWETVMGNNPSKSKGYNNPVEMVSWHDAYEFIRCLNKMENTSKYRLPTEAEWEYAARAGAAYGETYIIFQDTPKEPNPWGLYNMHGGVWEWVQDWYDSNYYVNSPVKDPLGPLEGEGRVIRGVAWLKVARSSFRYASKPGEKRGNIGFRLAFSPEDEAAKK
jgi:formylglycine-generating enzyme required for sulfatase activity